MISTYLSELVIAYLILWLFYYFGRSTNLSINPNIHRATFGWLSFFLFITIVYQYFELWHTGYIYEHLAFFNRALGPNYLVPLLIQPLILGLAALNIFEKVRRGIIFQRILMFFLIVYLLGWLSLGGVGSTSAIPGWHTTIYPNNFGLIVLFFVSIMFAINIVLKVVKER